MDDHKMFTESLARLLTRQPKVESVRVASSVGAVRTSLGHGPVDLAVVDWHLADGTGSDVISLVKAAHPDTPVVVLTGSMEPSVIRAALECGCAGFVTKDRAADELLEAIDAGIQGEMRVSPRALAIAVDLSGRSSPELSEREIDVINGIARGGTNADIAAELFLSVNTVRNHIQRIAGKLCVTSRVEIVVTALRQGLIDLP
ncbi:MAG: response regulator [Microthrixaceae bacterium]